jgi:hypothetical protein
MILSWFPGADREGRLQHRAVWKLPGCLHLRRLGSILTRARPTEIDHQTVTEVLRNVSVVLFEMTGKMGTDQNGTYLSPKEAFAGSSAGKKEAETPVLRLGSAFFRSALVGSKLAFSLK